jgi:hypothetical protein
LLRLVLLRELRAGAVLIDLVSHSLRLRRQPDLLILSSVEEHVLVA